MDGFELNDIMEMDAPRTRAARSKPLKRKWREIEAIKDKRRLQKELNDMDIGLDFAIEDIKL
ncbi:DUF3545 domain-containing protein [Vibrio sp. 10N.286.49.C2]|uniref:DUF3545 family protein n=1 Tax=unclassified Vibrio TaxID=2614977 RepID=UPI000C842E20|nr:MULTISPECIES: DUF3545 family protein [unclassified Vibrio]PMH27608.1 DUF3545 domain-containing protein [Vibrio sp. 10N.286.49.C2]PMH53034.1 DUF3545 domain-containing protein [Vibrio sp. 10N.286.49.B1]PMH77812.1 DUF3545 domain-containing protein [Vibrio sp. 10N.286.48.B7]